MKLSLLISGLGLMVAMSACGPKPDEAVGADAGAEVAAKTVELTSAEAGCGQCLLGLKGKSGCDLAVRIDGATYFVDGYKMEQFGDPHSAGGLCETTRKANVAGTISNGRFVPTTFEVLPAGH